MIGHKWLTELKVGDECRFFSSNNTEYAFVAKVVYATRGFVGVRISENGPMIKFNTKTGLAVSAFKSDKISVFLGPILKETANVN